jgi:hypothetical protein
MLRGAAWASASAAIRRYLDHWLDLAHSAGLDAVRPTDFLDGVSDWRAAAPWQNLDHLVTGAASRGMVVILDLSAYRNLLLRLGARPYDPRAWSSFLNFVGSRYARAEAVAYYAIAGEPAPPAAGASTDYVAFYRAALARLHAADRGHHLISTGGLNHLEDGSAIPWQQLFELPGQDLVALHLYSDDDRQLVLPVVAAWAAQERKPLVVEEFGFRQDVTDAARAALFREAYRGAWRYHAAGMVFWNLGPELSPASYDVGPQTPAVWGVVHSARNSPP